MVIGFWLHRNLDNLYKQFNLEFNNLLYLFNYKRITIETDLAK